MKNYVCADCGFEQDSMDRACDKCRSVRVVAASVVEELLGKDWRDTFKIKKEAK